MQIDDCTKGPYLISTDKKKLDAKIIHQFLTHSYWAQGRSLDEIKFSLENSLCFGLYKNNQQIGFARILTDYIFFAYLLDVFILKEEQGQGLGKWLIETIFADPTLKNIHTWMLGTKDAHAFYQAVGFKPHEFPERIMVRRLLTTVTNEDQN